MLRMILNAITLFITILAIPLTTNATDIEERESGEFFRSVVIHKNDVGLEAKPRYTRAELIELGDDQFPEKSRQILARLIYGQKKAEGSSIEVNLSGLQDILPPSLYQQICDMENK